MLAFQPPGFFCFRVVLSGLVLHCGVFPDRQHQDILAGLDPTPMSILFIQSCSRLGKEGLSSLAYFEGPVTVF